MIDVSSSYLSYCGSYTKVVLRIWRYFFFLYCSYTTYFWMNLIYLTKLSLSIFFFLPLSRYTNFTISLIHLPPLFVCINVIITCSLILSIFCKHYSLWLAFTICLLIFFSFTLMLIRIDKNCTYHLQPYHSFFFL